MFPVGERTVFGVGFWCNGVLTGVWGGGISAAPLWLAWPVVAGWPGGLLIEIVGKGRDARAAARVAGRWRICERFGGPDMGPSARVGAPWGVKLRGCGSRRRGLG